MLLRKLRSPENCGQQAGGPGESPACSQQRKLQAGSRRPTSSSRRRASEIPPHSASLSYSGNCMRPSHGGEGDLLCSLPSQMLTSSKNTLVDILGIIFDQMSGYRVAPVNVKQKINSHNRWSVNII